jgi:hypothetical protein
MPIMKLKGQKFKKQKKRTNTKLTGECEKKWEWEEMKTNVTIYRFFAWISLTKTK